MPNVSFSDTPISKQVLVNNLVLRDTNTHSSTTDQLTIFDWDLTGISGKKILIINNNTNQTVKPTIYMGYANIDGQRWSFSLDDIPANSTEETSQLVAFSEPSAFLAISITSTVAPTSGSISVYGLAGRS